ncbi:DoxX family protein [Streptomyces sp. TLI_171]|uniref:DoxX family protein n=1 Tax=Streptomyces sp. TLI_171 TaxID=1938859 RepID=UPI00217E5926|nr:DoxX family protein [Streptomyces sp. TLI_171]
MRHARGGLQLGVQRGGEAYGHACPWTGRSAVPRPDSQRGSSALREAALVLFCVAFLASGLSNGVQPRERLVAAGTGWAAEVSPKALKALGALGLVLRVAVNTAPGLVGWAAVRLAVTMLGAVVVHVRTGR